MSDKSDEQIDAHLEAWANLTDEQLRAVARLRAENKRLADDNRRLTECWDTEAQMHRIDSAQWQAQQVQLENRIVEIQTENERLRAVLKPD